MLARAERLHREFSAARSASRQPAWEPPVDILETPATCSCSWRCRAWSPTGRGGDRRQRSGDRRHARAAARAAHGRHPPAGAAAGPLRAPRAPAGRPLPGRPPLGQRRLPADHAATRWRRAVAEAEADARSTGRGGSGSVAVGRPHHRAGAQHRAVSRASCCRSRSAGRARSPRRSRRCASSARSAS